jgi:hypothetical protein
MERPIGILPPPSTNPLVIAQIIQSSVVAADAMVVVMSTVGNIQAAVLIILVVGNSRGLLVKQSVFLPLSV